ncbi:MULTISPECIES: efflux RND transporter permease subunit [Marinimicrobium]|uniref:Hydrophobe/amphiphile efflux-1 (HAE1) family protein n=5 Tax=Marinimicrobium TaxID=359337 RepID=A0A3N1NWA0_9GAMM|nr:MULTISPECIES: efflux RND transporter permease subunit [Marinimicrobium]ROQ19751.1 hydrophobe/amphiphile efflux-1 (HAE1) family protein [Marinimicrobium koreense]
MSDEKNRADIQEVNDLPSLSIRRPILVLVINLLIALAGAAAILAVEVRELPNIDYPYVSVNGNYPGASPETMDAEVTSVVEGAVARVTGLRSVRSDSEEGNFRMSLEFNAGVDLNDVASEVREAVSRVQRELPEDVEQLTVVKADPDAQSIINIAAISDSLSETELTQRIERDIIPELISVTGVADVQVFGGRNRIVRVVMDPMKLASFGLGVTDVANALRNAPYDVPSGSYRSSDQELLVRADATATTEEDIRSIIVEGNTRVGDIARVFYTPRDADSLVRFNGQPVVGMGVIRQAQSNTLEISNGIREILGPLDERLTDVELTITEDNATFIRGSVKEVITSLLLTVAIVIGTIWLFIGSFRVTLVPSLAIPIALIGTVAAIWALGFSINILTLLALVLATGLVVDDAIVVLENIQRRRGQGLGARAAAVLGTRQVFFAVVATTAVLVSVFVPIAILPSTAGRLFREFGFVLSIAVAISSFVALSLVPAAAARISPEREGQPHPFRNKLTGFGNRMVGVYSWMVDHALRYAWTTFGIALLIVALAGYAYTQVPKELVPSEDRGVIYIGINGPEGVGLDYIERQAGQVSEIVQPIVASGEARLAFSILGWRDPNRALFVLPLADWSERSRNQQAIAAEIEPKLKELPGVTSWVGAGNSLNIRGGGGQGSTIELALTGPDYDEIYQAAQSFIKEVETRYDHISDPDLDYDPNKPQLSINVDRRRASELGVELADISATLRAMVDGYDLVDLSVGDEAIPIILESATGQIRSPDDLLNLYISSSTGELLPLSSVVTLTEENIAAELERNAQRRSIEIEFQLDSEYPLQTAVDDVRAVAADTLPRGIGLIFQGEAQTLDETSREVALTYIIALVVVFLVLCAQFESFTSALIVMVTVPFGIAAAILAILITGTSINIYSQIGLVMLIGLMAKNGILLVEFADQLRDLGHDVYSAVRTAALVRLRPIAMTLMSTVLGGLPLILSSGPGAESRWAIGWVIFGGLGLAALFTLFLTPVVYLGLARFAKPRAAEGERLHGELADAEAIPDSDAEWRAS